jgi:branched-chain amino acid transport system ATP-binding protein
MLRAMDATPLIRIDGLRKTFGGVTALNGISLEIGDREIIGMLGPNGSGKTTLVNCLSGVLRRTDGRIEFDGTEITRWSRARRARRGLIRTYQNLRLFSELTAAEKVELGLVGATRVPARERRRRVAAALEDQGLGRVARLPVRGLPYGEQRRVEIARAVVSRPRLLLLDEPAAGLGDGETRLLRATILRARDEVGCAVLLIDHDVDLVLGLSDAVAVLHEGAIVRRGEPSAVRHDPYVAEIYLGAEVATAC